MVRPSLFDGAVTLSIGGRAVGRRWGSQRPSFAESLSRRRRSTRITHPMAEVCPLCLSHPIDPPQHNTTQAASLHGRARLGRCRPRRRRCRLRLHGCCWIVALNSIQPSSSKSSCSSLCTLTATRVPHHQHPPIKTLPPRPRHEHGGGRRRGRGPEHQGAQGGAAQGGGRQAPRAGRRLHPGAGR